VILINPQANKVAGVITQDEGTGKNTGVAGSSPDPMREREETGKPSAYSGPTTTGPNTDPK
jgi:hypothetical protein